jgi:Ca2+-binding EF-hand superfamily protein
MQTYDTDEKRLEAILELLKKFDQQPDGKIHLSTMLYLARFYK